MTFNWEVFLRKHGIDYATSGRNVAGGNIAVKCPWCGPNDPSQHMGISVKGNGWGCLRNKQHRGKSPARLIAALIGCGMSEALAIAGMQRHIPSNLLSEVEAMLRPKPLLRPAALSTPKEFFEFGRSYAEHPFVNYLLDRCRGFSEDVVRDFAHELDLRWCLNGAYRYRIIFPVYFDNELVTWTGRSIGDATIRYRTLSYDEEKSKIEGYPPAHGPASNYLLWYDDLVELGETGCYHTLVICEGPFDALRVRMLGDPHGITATCLFTANASSRQVELLHGLASLYERQIVLLDAKTLAAAMELRAKLASLPVAFSVLPGGVKDPGEIRHAEQLRTIVSDS